MSGQANGSTPRGPVRVVVVSDSATRRAELVRALEVEGDIVAVGQAGDAFEAVRTLMSLRPDVTTIDLPTPSRQHAVEQIMNVRPTPILVIVPRPLAANGMGELIGAGAVGAFDRPARWTAAAEADVRRQVRVLRGVTVVRHPRGARPGAAGPAQPATASGRHPVRLLAIAASTGGPPALATVLGGLAGVATPILVVQHIHTDFLAGLVSWMDHVAPQPVRLARHGETARAGVVYIGPDGVHLKIGPGLRIDLDAEPPSRHRPSANQLFVSVARHVGPGGVGVILTGMGDDGAAGLLALRQAGGLTIAQDEASSAVFGMPHAADQAGAASRVLPLDKIAPAVEAATRDGSR